MIMMTFPQSVVGRCNCRLYAGLERGGRVRGRAWETTITNDVLHAFDWASDFMDASWSERPWNNLSFHSQCYCHALEVLCVCEVDFTWLALLHTFGETVLQWQYWNSLFMNTSLIPMPPLTYSLYMYDVAQGIPKSSHIRPRPRHLLPRTLSPWETQSSRQNETPSNNTSKDTHG